MNSIHKLRAKKVYNLGMILVFLCVNSCRKHVEVSPPITSETGASVYTQDQSSIEVLTGIYIRLSQGNSFASGNTSISLFCGLSADELSLFNGVASTDTKTYLYANSLFANLSFGSPGSENWAPLYNYIFICNDAIEGLNKDNGLTPSIKQQLLGEAKFLRALCYFYLVNLWGDVPIVTSSDYKINSILSPSVKSEVYEHIISDLKDAQNLLSSDYLDGSLLKPTTERVRPTKWVATALLSRVYLYTEDYNNSEIEASSLINNSSLFELTTLPNVFLKNSRESIWQLQPVNIGWNTEDARIFVLTGAPNISKPVYLNPSFINEFENNDQRKLNWLKNITVSGITYNYPSKYKSATNGNSVTEYLMAFRLAEQFLIRAEARTMQNKFTEAQADLNSIRFRAGLSNTSANDRSSLLTAILHERKIELFTEWGHRWLDLKRTNNVDAIMSNATPLKVNGAIWKSYQQWYPLPASQIVLNPNLNQNEGY